MKKIGRALGSGRLLAVAGLFGIALMAVIAVPMIASAGEYEIDAPNRPPLTVATCEDRVAAEDPRRDDFLDELVADEVISTDQAAEIDARLDVKHFERCVARILFNRGTAIDATASVTGTEKREVLGAIVAGQSLSEYADEHGIDDATLVDAIMQAPSEKAAELIANGEFSQEDVDGVLARIEERVNELIHVTDVAPHRLGDGHGGAMGDD